jgi:hypothetical protein
MINMHARINAADCAHFLLISSPRSVQQLRSFPSFRTITHMAWEQRTTKFSGHRCDSERATPCNESSTPTESTCTSRFLQIQHPRGRGTLSPSPE